MDIGQAVAAMREGLKVSRAGWNGKGMYLYLEPEGAAHLPDDGGGVMLPHVAMRTAQGPFVPWLCSQTDLLANDWEITHG